MAALTKCLAVIYVPQRGASSRVISRRYVVFTQQFCEPHLVMAFKVLCRRAADAHVSVLCLHRIHPLSVLSHLADRLRQFGQSTFPVVVPLTSTVFAARQNGDWVLCSPSLHRLTALAFRLFALRNSDEVVRSFSSTERKPCLLRRSNSRQLLSLRPVRHASNVAHFGKLIRATVQRFSANNALTIRCSHKGI